MTQSYRYRVRPTRSAPGTPRKLTVLASRAAQQLPLFHHRDEPIDLRKFERVRIFRRPSK